MKNVGALSSQIKLQKEIIEKAGINVVNCPSCRSICLVRKGEDIICPDCDAIFGSDDSGDLYHHGLIDDIDMVYKNTKAKVSYEGDDRGYVISFYGINVTDTEYHKAIKEWHKAVDEVLSIDYPDMSGMLEHIKNKGIYVYYCKDYGINETEIGLAIRFFLYNVGYEIV